MYWFLVVISCTLATAEYNYFAKPQSAASDAQIKFAIENKYDDTGPGAKGRETAYNTYKNLDEALLSYLDDPDTKLPELEKAIAVNKLVKTNKYYTKGSSFLPKPVFDYTQKPFGDFGKKGYWNFKEGIFNEKIRDGSPRIPLLKGPGGFGFYSAGALKAVSPSPLYSLVYDVNHERQSPAFPAGPGQRDLLRGYYSLKDGDGRTRLIQYSLNQNGYSASERSDVTK